MYVLIYVFMYFGQIDRSIDLHLAIHIYLSICPSLWLFLKATSEANSLALTGSYILHM